MVSVTSCYDTVMIFFQNLHIVNKHSAKDFVPTYWKCRVSAYCHILSSGHSQGKEFSNTGYRLII